MEKLTRRELAVIATASLTSLTTAKLIALAGMDFGSAVGKYSKKQVPSIDVKRKKLKMGKELLEWLAAENGEKIKLYNITSNGENIKGFKKITTAELKKLV